MEDTGCTHSTSTAIEYNEFTDLVTWQCWHCPEQWTATPTEDDRQFEELINGGCVGCQ